MVKYHYPFLREMISMLLWILLGLGAALLITLLVFAVISYRNCFYSAPRKPRAEGERQIATGKKYDPYRELFEAWSDEYHSLPKEDVWITAFDGLKLHGTFIEYAPGAPIEIMFHGYRGTAERDLAGGVHRCQILKRSCLLVDQRGSERSEGNVLTFGILEHRDCLKWVDYVVARFGSEVPIILTGVSMGATTVLTAAGKELPSNVIGVLADCPFSSSREIMLKVLKDKGLPRRIIYPLLRISARLVGHFKLEETSPVEAMKTCTVPVLLIHGEEDHYVPLRMSRKIYAACKSRKRLVIVPGAAHCLCYPVDQEGYLQVLREFFGPEASFSKK